MISILPLVGPLTKLATAALDHVNLRKSELSKAEKQDQLQRLQKLEDSDLEQGELLGELSENVEQLARAVENHIQATRRLQWLVYLALAFSAASLIISLTHLFK